MNKIINTVVKKIEKSQTEVVKTVQYGYWYRAPVQRFLKAEAYHEKCGWLAGWAWISRGTPSIKKSTKISW